MKDNTKEQIIEKYKKMIKEIYEFSDDNEMAHLKRDFLCIELIKELGYKELANLLVKAEEDIGFWYA